MSIPIYLPYYVLGGAVATIVAILIGIGLATSKAGWSQATQSRTMIVSSLVLIAWFAASLLLALLGAFQAHMNRLPTIQYGIFIPILIGALLISRSSTIRQLIDAIPQEWLVAVQAYRALGVVFLLLYASGRMPGLFAWPAGLGDFLVGVTAPIIALSFSRNPQNSDLVQAWNWFGILDLVIAITTGFLSSPSPFQVLSFDFPNSLISTFPLVLIPTFLVPLSILLHIASLAKLNRTQYQKQGEQRLVTKIAS
jgi:hypothetical protein